MFKFEPYIRYKVNGVSYESRNTESTHYELDLTVSENAVKCILKPKAAMEMLEFRLNTTKTLDKKEVFFANG